MSSPLQNSSDSFNPGRQVFSGTLRNFAAEALILPTGLITAAFLTRKLGPADYGFYTLAAASTAWLEWTIVSVFSRSTIKFVSASDDWHPLGAVVLRWHLIISLAAMLTILLGADLLAELFDAPVLSSYFRLFALDIPLFSLAHAHTNILLGLGRIRERALACGSRWTGRLLLIVLLVEMGLSVEGAILGSIGASIVELCMARYFVRPSFSSNRKIDLKQFWNYSAALFMFVLSIRLFERIDLFSLKALGGTAAQAGFYAAAQNLTLVPGLFALSFSPILLAVLSRTLHEDRSEKAKQTAREAMRTVILLLPMAGMIAGASSEIVELVFGRSFLDASPLLSFLIFGAIAMVMISVATTILTAGGKPRWTFILTGPLVPSSILGNMIMIPRLGPVGAALVTTALSFLAAAAAVLSVHRLWSVLPPAGSFYRSLVVTIAAYLAAQLWPAEGFWMIVKLACISCAIPALLLCLGEFKSHEIAMIKSAFAQKSEIR
jgi:O-antigen/teichoic acid export membrane protein